MIMTNAQKLADAQAKLHQLETGGMPVEVMTDGYLVRYQRTNLEALRSYVRTLDDCVAGRNRGPGAIGFTF